MVHATIAGLKALRRPEDVAKMRERELHQVAPRPLLDAAGLGTPRDAEPATAGATAEPGETA
jgi:small subunit ribosomal protein S5